MSDEPELYLNAYAIERPNGSTLMQFFLDKMDAYGFIENHYDMEWSKIQRKYKLKIVKVQIIKKKWRS